MKPKENKKQSGSYDNCQTPTYAWNALKLYMPRQKWSILEPAAGEGYLARDMAESGYDVQAEDLHEYENLKYPVTHGVDFLETPPKIIGKYFDAIVTNPPYSGKLKFLFLEKCLQANIPFALLMPVEFCSTKAYYNLTVVYDVIPHEIRLSSRVNFKMPNKGWDGSSAQFPVMWYTNKLGNTNQINYVQVNRGYTSEHLYESMVEYVKT